MIRSRNRAAVFRTDAFAEVLLIATDVENLHVATPELLEQTWIRREYFRTRIDLEIRRRKLLDFGAQLLSRRRLEPAIKHSRPCMPRVFERPLTARRSHPGFVFIKHHGLAPADSERRKYPLELRAELRDAPLRRISMMKRERIEMPRAADMP